MTKQETKIANAMLTTIEKTTDNLQQGSAIERYQQFLRACIDRRQAEKRRA